MAGLTPGTKAPAFHCIGGDGRKYSLKDFKGRTIVLFFYPEDDTSVCTREACAFRDRSAEFRELGVELIGVSPDQPESHRAFSSKYGLDYLLLSDPDMTMMKQYGVWGKKVMFGHRFMGVIRTTVIIDGSGTVTHYFPRVRVNGHAERVLAAVKENR
ncbi:MAG: peroxiredoxin [Bacteroidetes bacterium]|nr:peroxiredoxin [Bacteroidota bacterium]